MYMFMNKTVKIFLVLVFSFFSCNGYSDSIFDDMFAGINEDPLVYKDNSEFDFEAIYKNDTNFPAYAKIYNCDGIYTIKNDSMLITYWNVADKIQIQYITINGKNAKHPFCKFIGKKADDVLKRYSKNTDYELSKSELRYNSNDLTFFIQFKIKEEKICQIVIGKNL